MKYILAFALVSCSVSYHAISAPISYSFIDYEIGVSRISGTVTTDGTIGSLGAANVVSMTWIWSNDVAIPPVTVIASEADLIAATSFTATATELSVSATEIFRANESPNWILTIFGDGVNVDYGGDQNFTSQGDLADFEGLNLSSPLVFATATGVPEGGITLAMLGFALTGCGLFRHFC